MLVPPPTYPIAMIALAVALGRALPLGLPRGPLALLVGGTTGVIALALLLSAVRTFRRASTAIEPWKSTRQLITTGVFARSRNPVYVSFLLGQLSIAWLTGNAWVLLLVPVAWLLLDRLQVRREERYLTTTFGDAYDEYCRLTPRWL